jgi:alkaline phosphatase D
MRLFFLFIAALASQAAHAQPVAGPMLGPVTRHTASIWVQGDQPASVALEVSEPGSAKPAWTTAARTLDRENDFSARLDLDQLASETRYQYRLVWDGVALEPVYRFATLAGQPAGYKVYLGSCAHVHDPETDGGKPWSGGFEIFDRIAGEAADDAQAHLMLWLGDNIYLRADDYEHPAGMSQRYRKVRSHPSLQKLLPALPHYAIWDDHDYGPNDHNQSFVFKQTSLDLFKRYWPNPSAGLPGIPGIFTAFSIGDADFFLLDDRWHRDSDRDLSAGKVLFGQEQMRWLKNALLASRARFKFIAGGSQFLNDLSRFEGWHNFKEERGDFLFWLQQNKVSGVMFLSGDRHRTELLRMDRPDAYPLYELTCSPLTSGVHKIDAAEAEHPARVPGTLVSARNYCTLAAEGSGNERRLVVKSLDAAGKLFWEARIEAAALK